MNLTKTAFKFAEWFNSDKFPKELEKADVEETVLAWADATETDLGDNLDNLCQRIVDLGIL
jgi:hypothetical protein